MKKSNELRNVILIYLFMYFVHFIFLPRANGDSYEAAFFTVIVITLFGMFSISHNILFWLLGLIIYTLSIFCNNLIAPLSSYNIGHGFIFPSKYNPEYVPSHIIIFSSVIFILQFLIWIAVVILKFIKRKFFDKNTNKNNEN